MPNPPRDVKVTYRVEFKNNLMARRTALTDYSCICTNNPSNRNGAAKWKRDLAAWFYPRVSSRRREKGCGFLEAVFKECLEIELRLQGVPFVPSVRFRVFGVFRGLIPVTAVVPALCSLRLQLLAAGNLLWLLSCRFRGELTVAQTARCIANKYAENHLILWPRRRFSGPFLGRKRSPPLASPTCCQRSAQFRSLARTESAV